MMPNFSLIRARLNMGFNKEDFAKTIGVTVSDLDKYEDLGLSPTEDVRARISDVLCTSEDHLFSESGTDWTNAMRSRF